MARTPDEVQQDYGEEYRAIDPSVESTKGPIFDFIVRPNSRFISEAEERQDRTDRLASNDFTAVASDEELERMAAGVGAGVPQGEVATTQQTFGTYSRPKSNQVIQIPQGSIVGTSDGGILYQTTEPAQIDGDYPDRYLNPSRRTYEILVPIQSVSAGSKYNLPPTRVRKLVSTIEGIDFTENRFRIRDGKDPGTVEDLVERAQNSLQGQELGSIGGLQAGILSAFQENVLSVSVVTSAEYHIFRRQVTKPGIDIYYAGEIREEIELNSTALGGELTIDFDNTPILEVIEVLINGSSVTYEVVEDDDPATMGSQQDSTHILLESALSPGDAILVRYAYDSLAGAISTAFSGSNSLFETDTLVRKSFKKNPTIHLSGKTSSTFNPFALRKNIEDSIINFFETNEHGSVYLPSVLEDYLEDRVIGLSSRPTIGLFHLEERALRDIEPIQLRKNEVAAIDFDKIELSIS